MGFNDGLAMASSYYAATAAPAPEAHSLDETTDADLCVVGGGCTGLSAALEAAERGWSVVLLEGGRIGWGASGRNGGQMIPGLRKGAADLVRLYGRERARALFDLALEARALVLERIARHAIACDLKTTGHLSAAIKRSDLAHMDAEAACLAEVMDYPHVRRLSAEETRAEAGSPDYVGGLLDLGGGHLHPLNYTLGLAAAAQGAGVRLFEGSAALGLDRTASGVTVRTSKGSVRARRVVLAGDALMSGLAPRLDARIMPVANYIVATEPLADPSALIPNDRAVSDSRFVVNYYRLSADGRLLFGGGERYTPDPPRDIEAFVRRPLEATFPQLKGVRIDHGWGGLVSITRSRLPDVGRDGDVLYAHGYSGMGVLLSTLAGKLMVEAAAGDAGRFERLACVAPPAFPGGARLRGPLHVLGMAWFALRDRL